jgi:hypothetical protein
LDPVTAHRIESGFYRQFSFQSTDSGSGPLFLQAEPVTNFLSINTQNLQEAAARFIGLFNSRGTTEASAKYRFSSAVISALGQANENDIGLVLPVALDTAYNSGYLSLGTYKYLKSSDSGNVAAAMKRFANANQQSAYLSLLTATVIEKLGVQGGAPSDTDIATLTSFLPENEQGFTQGLTGAYYGRNDGLQRLVALANGAYLINPERNTDRELLARLEIDPKEIRNVKKQRGQVLNLEWMMN